MKKIKFLGAAVLAASLIFAGCSSPAGAAPEINNPIDNNENNNETGQENNNNNNNNENGLNENNNNQNNYNETGNNETGNNETGNNETGNQTSAYAITFLDAANSSTYADDVYTVTLATAHDAGDEWGNQIWILNPNKSSGIAAGDKIHAAVTLEANKEITSVLVKDEFNHGSYSGIDTTKNLPANTPTVFDIYGTVADDFDDSARFVIAIRGNEAGTTLKVSEIKVEKLGNYSVSEISIDPVSKTVKAGENVSFKVFDQYGFEIEEATIEIISQGVESTLEGKILKTGDVSETVEVKATYGSFEVTATITVETIVAATESWGLDLTNDNTSIGILPLVNVASWGGADTAPVVEEFAGRKAIKLTIPTTYGWIGAAWQADPNVNKIDVSGYSTITLTFNDSAFAEGESLTDYNIKLLGGAEVPLKGTVSNADEDGWKTITISLADYAAAGVSLSGIGCINFCDWKAGETAPSAGALYISAVSFNPAAAE